MQEYKTHIRVIGTKLKKKGFVIRLPKTFKNKRVSINYRKATDTIHIYIDKQGVKVLSKNDKYLYVCVGLKYIPLNYKPHNTTTITLNSTLDSSNNLLISGVQTHLTKLHITNSKDKEPKHINIEDFEPNLNKEGLKKAIKYINSYVTDNLNTSLEIEHNKIRVYITTKTYI